RPTITGIADNGDGTFTLTGTQLTGISEGSNYGDDMESNTNYPIVQFKDAAGNVYYGRTTNWSTTDVATDGASETVKFTLPAGKTRSDVPWISVIANGIANGAPKLTPPADQKSDEGASHTFDLGSFSDANGGGPWTVDVDWNDGTAHTTFNMSSPGTITQQSHTYREEGSYTVTVTVTNTIDGEFDSKIFTVKVSDPSVVAGGVDINAKEGISFSLPVATFTDPGGAEAVGDYSADIDWGDGTGTQVGAGTISFSGTLGSKTD